MNGNRLGWGMGGWGGGGGGATLAICFKFLALCYSCQLPSIAARSLPFPMGCGMDPFDLCTRWFVSCWNLHSEHWVKQLAWFPVKGAPNPCDATPVWKKKLAGSLPMHCRLVGVATSP